MRLTVEPMGTDRSVDAQNVYRTAYAVSGARSPGCSARGRLQRSVCVLPGQGKVRTRLADRLGLFIG